MRASSFACGSFIAKGTADAVDVTLNAPYKLRAGDKWLVTKQQRGDRTHGAEGVIPVPVWIVLFLAAGAIFVYMLFFADSAERAVVQATMIGGVAVVITSTLLLLLGFMLAGAMTVLDNVLFGDRRASQWLDRRGAADALALLTPLSENLPRSALSHSEL